MKIKNITALQALLTLQGAFEQLCNSPSAKYYRIGFLARDVKEIRARLVELDTHIGKCECSTGDLFKPMEVLKWELPGERSANISMVYLEQLLTEFVEFLITDEQIHKCDIGIQGDESETALILLRSFGSLLNTPAVFFQDRMVVNVSDSQIGPQELEKDAMADLLDAANGE
jgi:hypothetical protein